MKKISLLAAIAVACVANPALAQGPYIQATGGFERMSQDGEHENGFSFGGAIGYDLNISDAVSIGVEATLDDSTTHSCVSDINVVGDKLCLVTGRDIGAVGRIVYNLSDSSKIYALAGYSNARIKIKYSDGLSTERVAGNADGFRAGAGFQQNLTDHVFTKLEYRYSNYESDLSRHQALVGVGYNF